MQKRLVQATATAIIFASMAVPAFAQGNGHSEGRGLSIKIEGKHDNGLHLGWLKNGKHGDDEDKNEALKSTIAQCLETARKAHDAAIKAAAKVYRAAQSDARSAYYEAIKTAQKTRKTAQKDARVAFKASAKDQAAIDAYAAAKLKASTDWQAAVKTAQDAFSAAKSAAATAWKDAKTKADADFKAAKLACAATANPSSDTTAPAAATLSLSGATSSSVLVSWTAPGDDGSTGTAASYDLRYSTSAITDANFASATQVSGEPTPAVAGTAQSMTVSGLDASTTYYFAMKCQDEVPNVSALSNVPSIATLAPADTTAPAAITTLALSGATASSVDLTWIATGDDGITGTAASYDVRYSTSPISTAADFAAAAQVTGEPSPAVAGLTQSMTVSGLASGTTYYFAIEASDEAGNVSSLSNVPTLATL